MRTVSKAYLHIGNGGVEFSVTDEGHGPCVRISSSHFGNNMQEQKLFVQQSDLATLAKIFQEAADHQNYSEPYCHAATTEKGDRSGTCEAAGPGTPWAETPQERIVLRCGTGHVMEMNDTIDQPAPPKFEPLSPYYNTMDVFGEKSVAIGSWEDNIIEYMPFGRTPMSGTIRGSIRNGEVELQTFFVDTDGNFTISCSSSVTLLSEDPIVTNGVLVTKDNGKQAIRLHWAKDPGPNTFLLLNYEFEAN
jgi:hypothetical protein